MKHLILLIGILVAIGLFFLNPLIAIIFLLILYIIYK